MDGETHKNHSSTSPSAIYVLPLVCHVHADSLLWRLPCCFHRTHSSSRINALKWNMPVWSHNITAVAVDSSQRRSMLHSSQSYQLPGPKISKVFCWWTGSTQLTWKARRVEDDCRRRCSFRNNLLMCFLSHHFCPDVRTAWCWTLNVLSLSSWRPIWSLLPYCFIRLLVSVAEFCLFRYPHVCSSYIFCVCVGVLVDVLRSCWCPPSGLLHSSSSIKTRSQICWTVY